jgi:penicillin-binding protein 1C
MDILAGALPPEPWAQARRVGGGRRIAYKTGTSYGFRDAWAIGATSDWTIGVWVGRADGTPRPGQYGRNAAAPVLFKVFDLLPDEDTAPTRPDDVLTVSRAAQLPPSLRKLAAQSEGGFRRERPPQILFPPDGATIELPREGAGFTPVALKAEGGTGALDWIVNGTPLSLAARTTPLWQPDGEGFARVVVLDRAGRSAVARVRVVPAPN